MEAVSSRGAEMQGSKGARSRLVWWAGRMAAGVFGLLLAWLVLEIGLRVAYRSLPYDVQDAMEYVRRVPWDDERIVPVPPWHADIDYGTIMPPDLDDYPVGYGESHFNLSTIGLWGSRVGLRTQEPQWPVDAVFLGDSFTVCWVEWEDCWVEKVRQATQMSVMNLGMANTGARVQERMLTDFGIPLEPRLVIWQWYGNDFNDDYGFGLLRGEFEPLDAPPAVEADPDFGWLADYSAVYAVVRNILWTEQHDRPEGWGQTVEVNGKTFVMGRDYHLWAFDMARPSNQKGWELYQAALLEGARVIREELGAELIMVLIPTKEEVYAGTIDEVMTAEAIARLSEGRQMMLDLCAREGWRCVDTTPALRAVVQAGENPYYGEDLHINAVGNAAVAEAVAEAVRVAGG